MQHRVYAAGDKSIEEFSMCVALGFIRFLAALNAGCVTLAVQP